MQRSASPVVSVLLPVRDGAGTIRRAINSIRAQTLGEWELLVIDDGSNDETRDIVAAIARQEPRVALLARPPEGIGAALNAGLAVARGSLIARMDADDESHPVRLEEQVRFLTSPANEAIGLVSCLVEFGGDRSANAGYALHVDWINALVSPAEIALNRFVESPLAHPSVMFRRNLVDRLGGYRVGDFPEDYELWLRWMDAGIAMAKVPRKLLQWNDRPERLSRTDSRYDEEKFFRVKTEWIARAVKSAAPAGTPVWIWGAGRPTRKRATLLQSHGVQIAGYIDVDAKKITPALGGKGPPVIAATNLPRVGQAFVLGYVSSRGARDLIRAALRDHGYEEGRNFLMCA